MKQDWDRIKNFLYSRVSSGDRGYAEWYGCCYEENQVQPVDLLYLYSLSGYGLIDDSYDVSLYNHQSPANCLCKNIERRGLGYWSLR